MGKPTHLTVQLSVSFLGGDEAPLVASKVRIDGQEVQLPLAFVIGGGNAPLQVVQGVLSADQAAAYARTFQSLASRFLEAALQSLATVPLEAAPEEPSASPEERPLSPDEPNYDEIFANLLTAE